jgi:glycerophosphoryl diester phosphodiesterase
MRNGLRALGAVVAAAIAMLLTAHPANAIPVDNILVAHRGATTSTAAEGTMRSYQYAVGHEADVLDGDVRWTKDGSDADHVGTMIISHDETLNRVTNCSGKVSSKMWSYIRDHCRTSTKTGKQRLIKLTELLAFAKAHSNIEVALQIKLTSLSGGQASQFWKALKASNARVTLEASSGQLSGLNKIKKLDHADRSYAIRYAFVTLGTHGWPSWQYVKSVGNSVHARLEIKKSLVQLYQKHNIRVFLFTGVTKSDYRTMVGNGPEVVVVDDVGKFVRWRNSAP